MFEIASIHDRVREFLEEPGSDLPVFDRTALLVHQEASREDPDTDKVVNLIIQDQVLVAEVLKVANSSFFRGIKKISRIQDAVVRIGLREVVNCVMMATQRKNYASRNPFVQQYTNTLWRHSVACAFGAQWLARRCGYEDLAPEAFIAGLIHDVGKLLVLKALVSVGEKDRAPPASPGRRPTSSSTPCTPNAVSSSWKNGTCRSRIAWSAATITSRTTTRRTPCWSSSGWPISHA